MSAVFSRLALCLQYIAFAIFLIGTFSDASDERDPYSLNPAMRDVRISSDGRFISMVNDRQETVHIVVRDLEGEEHRDIQIKEKNVLQGYSWAGSSKRIFFRQAYWNYENLEWMTYHIFDRKFRVLTLPSGGDDRKRSGWWQYGIDSFWYENPDIVVATEMRDGFRNVYHYDLESYNRVKRIAHFYYDVSHVMYSEVDGLARAYIQSHRTKHNFFQDSKTQQREDFFFRLNADDAWQRFERFETRFSDPGRIYDNEFPLALNYDGSVLYYAKEASSGRLGIYALDLAEGSELGPVLESEAFDCYSLVGDSATSRDERHFIYSQKKQSLVGFWLIDIFPRTLWIDPEFAAIQNLIDGSLPDRVNQVVDFDVAENRFVIRSYGPRDPVEYFLLDLEKGKITTLGRAHPWKSRNNIAAMTPIKIPSRDGSEIIGILSLPPNAPPKNLKVLIDLPGSPGDRYYMGRSNFADSYAARGYGVLSLNPRGTVGYGREYFEKGYEGDGQVLLEDIADAARFLVNERIASPDGVGLLGQGFGAYFCLRALTAEPELYQAAILEDPLVDIEDFLRDTNRRRKKFERWNYFELIANTLNREKPDFSSISAFTNLDRLDAPVLILGDDNTSLYVSIYAKELHARLQKLRKDVEYVSVADSYYDYGEKVVESRTKEATARGKFLDEYLPLSSEATSKRGM